MPFILGYIAVCLKQTAAYESVNYRRYRIDWKRTQ